MPETATNPTPEPTPEPRRCAGANCPNADGPYDSPLVLASDDNLYCAHCVPQSPDVRNIIGDALAEFGDSLPRNF